MTAHTEHHTLTFSRDMQRQLQVRSYRNAVDLLIDGINSPTRKQQGWSFDEDMAGYQEVKDPQDLEPNTKYRFTWSLHVNYASAKRQPNETEFAGICFTLYGRAITPAGGRWVLTEVDGKPYAPPSEKDAVTIKTSADQIGYADCIIPDDWNEQFEHVYGLDSHVNRVRRALDAAIASNWTKRFNVVLYGPPGCGKSEIALTVKKALGSQAVWSFDATAMTSAGLIKALNNAEIMPRVIVFEEIEKATPDALQPILGIADQRGEIVKTTARGTVDKAAKCLCICTVNDFDLFCKLQAGALANRFGNKVKFDEPGREVAMRVLRREIESVGGDQDWAEAAYDLCHARGITDMRTMITHCLCGQDGLLDGSYEKELDDTSPKPRTDSE